MAAWQGDAGLERMAQLAGDAPVQVEVMFAMILQLYQLQLVQVPVAKSVFCMSFPTCTGSGGCPQILII